MSQPKYLQAERHVLCWICLCASMTVWVERGSMVHSHDSATSHCLGGECNVLSTPATASINTIRLPHC
jgi:hypothetical protein